jgi:hypothetical protein
MNYTMPVRFPHQPATYGVVFPLGLRALLLPVAAGCVNRIGMVKTSLHDGITQWVTGDSCRFDQILISPTDP